MMGDQSARIQERHLTGKWDLTEQRRKCWKGDSSSMATHFGKYQSFGKQDSIGKLCFMDKFSVNQN